jgi:hypothetical protein
LLTGHIPEHGRTTKKSPPVPVILNQYLFTNHSNNIVEDPETSLVAGRQVRDDVVSKDASDYYDNYERLSELTTEAILN